MSGASDLFVIGAAGTRAYRAAMGAISENIANATTEGYNRRSIEIVESPVSSSTSPYYTPFTAFGGSQIDAVRRANDPYLDAAARVTGMAAANASERAGWNADIENAINDGELGVGRRLGSFFASAERLASNPSDTTLRTNMLFAIEQVAGAFRQSHNDLSAIRDGIATKAQNEVTTLNDAMVELARVNEELRRATPKSGAEANLLDSRDQALTAISSRINATFTFQDRGTVRVDFAGQAIVSGATTLPIGVTQNGGGTLDFTVNGTAVAAPGNGSIAGLAQSATVTMQRIASLDALANQFVAGVNSWHANGTTPGGAAGGPLLSIGANAGTIQLLTNNPADIAGAGGGSINGNLIAITSLRGNGSVEQGWSLLVSGHGNLQSATVVEQRATALRDQQARASRDDVSGVDLDREAADLLRLQQAYNASARVIQVAREIADTILRVT